MSEQDSIMVYYFDSCCKDYGYDINPIKVSVNGKLHIFTSIKDDGQSEVLHTIKIGDKFFLHADDCPTWVDDEGNFDFFQYGQSVKIEDLPIDDMDKCALLLKYTPNFKDDFYTYS